MGIRRAAAMAGLVLGLVSGTAQASYIINIDQVGTNVVASGSGSVDLLGFSYVGDGPGTAGIVPSFATVSLGAGESGDLYSGIVNGPSGFGSGGLSFASEAFGGKFGFSIFSGGFVLVPTGYTSGDDLGQSTATFADATLASLGLTAGTYVYTLEPQISFRLAALAAVDPNTITLNIGSLSTVPLPASAPMFGAALLGLAGFGYAAKRKKRIATA